LPAGKEAIEISTFLIYDSPPHHLSSARRRLASFFSIDEKKQTRACERMNTEKRQ
jgi:hypothetical protein